MTKRDKRAQRKQYKFVLKELVGREIKRKYARSYLGIVWSVLNPLLSMIVLTVIFSKMFQKSIENYPVYYLTGMIIWTMFTGATNAAMTTLVDNKNMLIKVRFPTKIFVMSRVYTALVNLGYSLIPYVGILLFFRIKITWRVIWFPLIIFCLLLFALGISYMLSVAYVFFGDVKHLYSVLLTLWMYCSAIFYPADMLPDNVRLLVTYNPIFGFINAAREVIMYGQNPATDEIIRMVIWSLGAFLIGSFVFEKNKNNIMQKM
ncbi:MULTISPECIES: ABC transporter permease [Blautia]|uniref:Transport permease protein n=1 Tax=Blautia argi TaxID=1912897 RepID=A0A2Z4UBS0_9FIRM|nr:MULTISPECIES: ABC transporter permease [Blautia]AWY98515.1 ABC transporter permease [Blautia argi]